MQQNKLIDSAPDQNKSNTLEYDGTQRLKFVHDVKATIVHRQKMC